MEYIYYLIIIALLLIIAFAITNSKRKDFKIEANKLVEYLGGKQNIIKYECNLSRFVVEVNDTTYHNDLIMTTGETNTLIVTVTNINNLQKTMRVKFDNK